MNARGAYVALLIAATAGIAAFARGRGGQPWLWGTLTRHKQYPVICEACRQPYGKSAASA